MAVMVSCSLLLETDTRVSVKLHFHAGYLTVPNWRFGDGVDGNCNPVRVLRITWQRRGVWDTLPTNPPLTQRRYGCTPEFGSLTFREPESGPEWRQQNVLDPP